MTCLFYSPLPHPSSSLSFHSLKEVKRPGNGRKTAINDGINRLLGPVLVAGEPASQSVVLILPHPTPTDGLLSAFLCALVRACVCVSCYSLSSVVQGDSVLRQGHCVFGGPAE